MTLDADPYMLYEGDITEDDAEQFRGLEGVLLQGKPEHGMGRNRWIARLQQEQLAAHCQL